MPEGNSWFLTNDFVKCPAIRHIYFFTSVPLVPLVREYQKLVGVDIYQASRDTKDLIGKGLVKLPRKGGRIYELLPFSSGGTTEKPPEYVALEAVLKENGFIKNKDIRKILRVPVRQATRIASRLVADGWLRSEGYLKMRRYFPVT